MTTDRIESLPAIPPPGELWRRLAGWIHLSYAVVFLSAVPHLFVTYWFLASVGQSEVFWTNFRTQAFLFLTGVVLVALAVVVPVRLFASSPALRRAIPSISDAT